MTTPDYQPKVANPFTEDGPAGEVFDADTITLITQLGASLSQRAVELAEENQQLKANRDLLRREINERNQLITGLRAQIAGSAGSAELVGQAWSEPETLF